MVLLQKGNHAKASGCFKQRTESVITLLPKHCLYISNATTWWWLLCKDVTFLCFV